MTENPRWIADEMLGRLARYLRFFGHDTLYARGWTDREIVRRAASETRIVLTRDRDVARRSPRALLLRTYAIGTQLEEVRRAFPSVPFVLTFDRCAECNAPLVVWEPGSGPPVPDGVAARRASSGLAIWECPECHRRFWEGSHTDRIRELVRGWLG